jgi:hypothetical protein
MKTSELTGAQLDHWVARANGWTFGPPHKTLECDIWRDVDGTFVGCAPASAYKPSTDWSQGGPIIERECINITTKSNPDMGGNQWMAIYPRNFASRGSGPTPLVAAMRAFVTRKFGEEVEVPHG